MEVELGLDFVFNLLDFLEYVDFLKLKFVYFVVIWVWRVVIVAVVEGKFEGVKFSFLNLTFYSIQLFI